MNIAGGNDTALVYNCPKDSENNISKILLNTVEQVAFISESENPKMRMMGGELCVNATMAFASILNSKGFLYTTGLRNKVLYKNKNNKTEISLRLNFKKIKNIILFEGIGYAFFKPKINKKPSKAFVYSLARKYNLPAFGVILYDKNKITPYIYVRGVDSFVEETACGSGSIAFSIFSGYKKIIQPSKGMIYVKIRNESINVGAKIKFMKKGTLFKETLLNKTKLNNLSNI